MDMFVPYAVRVGSTVIGGIESITLPSGLTVNADGGGNALYPEIATIDDISPSMSAQTTDVGTALAKLTAAGVNIASSNTTTAWFAKLVDGGTIGSTGRKYEATAGVVVPRSLTIPHRGNASMTFEVLPVSTDGDANPISLSEAQALPSVTGGNVWGLGSVELAGQTDDGARSVSIDFGISVQREAPASKVSPTVSYILLFRPVVTISGVNAGIVAAAKIPLAGAAGVKANTSIVLKKKLHGGTFDTDTITLTFDGTVTPTQWIGGSKHRPSEVNLRIDVTKVDGLSPFVVTIA